MRFSLLFIASFTIEVANCIVFSNVFSYIFGSNHCLCRCGVSKRHSIFSDVSDRELITPNEMPWRAYIYIQAGSDNLVYPYNITESNATAIVSGALISNKHVITAASPFDTILSSQVLVVLGSTNIYNLRGSQASVTSITFPPGYTGLREDNDLALLTLQYEVVFNNFISPICLPLHEKSFTLQTATVPLLARQGNETSYVPSRGIFPILSPQSCSMNANSTLIAGDKGCLGPVGSPGTLCGEPPGAPLMQRLAGRWRLIGVLSSASCYRNQSPLYTKISPHLQWVYTQMYGTCQCF